MKKDDAMPNSTTNSKQLCFVGRVGPAFSLDEIPASHAVLDSASVPRRLKGATLTLLERVSYLVGLLNAAEARPRKQIFIVRGKAGDVLIPEEYQKTEVKS